MEDEKFVELSEMSEASDIEQSGRCRIYNSSRDQVGCKVVSSESACQSWARSRNASAYAWSPGYEC